MAPRWGGLRPDSYDPDARDADNDGVLQEGTAWERPAGTRMLLEAGEEIGRGLTADSRPVGARIVDRDGNDVDYSPTWLRAGGATTAEVQQSPLADHGASSLREMGLPSLRQIIETRRNTTMKDPDVRRQVVAAPVPAVEVPSGPEQEIGIDPVAKKQLSVVFDGITPRAVDKQRPALTEAVDGELLPVPKKFGLDESGNPKFATVEDAVKHVADGGALEDIPNEFWGDVLARNSSEDIDDPNTKFHGVGGGGGIADTRIYLIRNPDGTLGNQGYVVKTASPKDNLGEMLGFNLAVAHGLNTEGAMWDGDTPWGRSVVLPHSFNLAPEGEIELPDYVDYHRDLLEGAVDGGMPQALAHFLHNYVLGIADRHAGNGMMMRVGDQIVIVPIDQGWIGQVSIAEPFRETEDAGLIDINSYASNFLMHKSILDDVSTHAKRANLSEEEAQEYAEKIIAVYDDMLERIESVVDQGRGAWHQYTPEAPEAPEGAKQYYIDTADMIFGSYEKRAQLLRDSRDAILDRLLEPSEEALAELETDPDFDSLDDLDVVSESPIVWSGRG